MHLGEKIVQSLALFLVVKKKITYIPKSSTYPSPLLPFTFLVVHPKAVIKSKNEWTVPVIWLERIPTNQTLSLNIFRDQIEPG